MKTKLTKEHISHMMCGGICQVTENGLKVVPAGASVFDTKSVITISDVLEIVNKALSEFKTNDL